MLRADRQQVHRAVPVDDTGDSARLLVVYKLSGYPSVKVLPSLKKSPGAVDVTFRLALIAKLLGWQLETV